MLAQSTKENTPLVKAIEDAVKDAYTERTLAEFDLVGMKIDPDMQGNWHTSFLDNLGTLKNKDSPKVKNHQNLQKGAYIRVIQDRNGEKSYGYFRIVDIDKEFSMPVEKMRDADGLPVKHRGIRFEDW